MTETPIQRYRGTVRRRVLFVGGASLVLAVVAAVALTTGPISLSLGDVARTLVGGGAGTPSRVVWRIRLPRIVAAVGAGVGLAVAGAAVQSILRNPLASPYTLGISQAAAFGAAVSIVVLGAGTTRDGGTTVVLHDPALTTAAAFVASLFSTGVILGVAKLRRATPETMILTGIALASLFTAGTATLEYFATSAQLASLVFWKFGDVSVATWRFDALLWLVVVVGSAYFVRKAWSYNVLDAGDETARSLGVDVDRVRIAGMLVASFVTATVVSLFGVIGFVGLVVPHIVRRAIGGDERFLLPASCVVGGALLLAADTLARTVVAPVVLPVGIVTSFVGVPLFVYLIVRGRDYW
ncbi:MAG: FecCD family ABC transporter permease [Salinigranum sp.]